MPRAKHWIALAEWTQFDSLDLRFLPVEISCDGRYKHLGAAVGSTLCGCRNDPNLPCSNVMRKWRMKVDFKTFKTFQKHVIVITLTYFVEIGISRFFYPSLEALSQPTSVSRTCLLLSSRFQQTVSAVPCLPLQLPNVGLKIFVDLALFLCLTPIAHWTLRCNLVTHI